MAVVAAEPVEDKVEAAAAANSEAALQEEDAAAQVDPAGVDEAGVAEAADVGVAGTLVEAWIMPHRSLRVTRSTLRPNRASFTFSRRATSSTSWPRTT